MSRYHSVEEYKEWLDSLPPEAFRPENGADTLVTYSGRDEQNHNLAAQAVERDPANKYCIEQTPAGETLDQDDLWGSESALNRQEAKEVWRHASEKTMENAKASNMETYVIDAKHDGIFRGTELHTALSNPNIKTINDVACERHMAQFDPQKIHESVCQSELARDEKGLAETHDAALAQSIEGRRHDFRVWQDLGDQYSPERQAMQDKADANFRVWRDEQKITPEHQAQIDRARALMPPPPAPEPERSASNDLDLSY